MWQLCKPLGSDPEVMQGCGRVPWCGSCSSWQRRARSSSRSRLGRGACSSGTSSAWRPSGCTSGMLGCLLLLRGHAQPSNRFLPHRLERLSLFDPVKHARYASTSTVIHGQSWNESCNTYFRLRCGTLAVITTTISSMCPLRRVVMLLAGSSKISWWWRSHPTRSWRTCLAGRSRSTQSLPLPCTLLVRAGPLLASPFGTSFRSNLDPTQDGSFGQCYQVAGCSETETPALLQSLICHERQLSIHASLTLEPQQGRVCQGCTMVGPARSLCVVRAEAGEGVLPVPVTRCDYP